MKTFLVKVIKTVKEVLLLATLVVPIVKGLIDQVKVCLNKIRDIWQ